MHTIDIVIPTYKPTKRLFDILDSLKHQTCPVRQIILMNTEEKYFEQLTYGTSFERRYPNVLVRHVSKREFDHGRTRRTGVSYSDAEIFVCMTDDAQPADEYLIEELVKGLEQEQVAVSYARQLAGANAGEIEKFTRIFNYPEQSCVKGKEDLQRIGIKTYFCSNVCAAYRRSIYDELGGFVRHTIFNEDMIYAACAVQHNYRIAYQADAKVYHSHDYTNAQQFHRNFDLGVSQADHPEVFDGIPSEGEGIRMVKLTTEHLRKVHRSYKIPGLYLTSACKLFGYKLGRHYKSLPHRLVLKCTMNREYWMQKNR